MGCTSGFESVSESLCLISLAIEKKTCSTFRFVFALCGKKNNKLCIRNKSNVRHMYLEKSDINYQLCCNKALSSTNRFKEFYPIFIGKSLPLRSGNSLKETNSRVIKKHQD